MEMFDSSSLGRAVCSYGCGRGRACRAGQSIREHRKVLQSRLRTGLEGRGRAGIGFKPQKGKLGQNQDLLRAGLEGQTQNRWRHGNA